MAKAAEAEPLWVTGTPGIASKSMEVSGSDHEVSIVDLTSTGDIEATGSDEEK